MQDWILKLLDLQNVDVRAAKLMEQVARVPAKKEETKQLYAEEVAACREAEDALKALELECRSCEQQIASLQEKKREFQTKTIMIRNNDEYKAALLQIEICDKSVKDLEDKQLELMMKIEEERAVVAERRKSVDSAKKRAESVAAEFDDLEKKCREEAALLLEGHDALRAAVVPDVLKIYDRLRSSTKIPKSNPCVVPINLGVCGRCRMKVTPQLCQDATNGKQVICPSCGALLYVE